MKSTMLLLMLWSVRLAAQTPAATLPEFRFFTPKSKPYTAADLPRQKQLFFIFFDSDCEHCQRAVAQLNKDYRLFSAVSVNMISVDDWHKIDFFLSRYAPRLKQNKNVQVLRDSLNQFISAFKPRRYPSMFLYSPEKKLLDYEDNDDTVFRIERLLAPKNKN